MISDNNTNLNLSYHPPNSCLLLLPRSLILSHLPLPFPLSLSICIHLHSTDTHTQISSDSTGRPLQTRRFLAAIWIETVLVRFLEWPAENSREMVPWNWKNVVQMNQHQSGSLGMTESALIRQLGHDRISINQAVGAGKNQHQSGSLGMTESASIRQSGHDRISINQAVWAWQNQHQSGSLGMTESVSIRQIGYDRISVNQAVWAGQNQH